MIPGITAGQMRQAVAPPGSLLLDTYPGAILAFSSSRKLRSAYSGACMRVRRDSDGTEQSIGFALDQLDAAALSAFCAGTTGRVVTWYDQSGNGVDAAQPSTTSAPIVFQSGSLTTINSTPALLLTGSQGFVTVTGAPWPSGVGEMTVALAYRVTGSSLGILIEAGYPGLHYTTAGSVLVDVNDGGSLLLGGSGANNVTSYGSAPNAAPPYNRVFKGVWNPGGNTVVEEIPVFRINGAAVTPSPVLTPGATTPVTQFNLAQLAIGARGNAGDLRLEGSLGEIILYPGTVHAASPIDNNLMTQYGI